MWRIQNYAFEKLEPTQLVFGCVAGLVCSQQWGAWGGYLLKLRGLSELRCAVCGEKSEKLDSVI